MKHNLPANTPEHIRKAAEAGLFDCPACDSDLDIGQRGAIGTMPVWSADTMHDEDCPVLKQYQSRRAGQDGLN